MQFRAIDASCYNVRTSINLSAIVFSSLCLAICALRRRNEGMEMAFKYSVSGQWKFELKPHLNGRPFELTTHINTSPKSPEWVEGHAECNILHCLLSRWIQIRE